MGTADLSAAELTKVADFGTVRTTGQGKCAVYNAAITDSGTITFEGASTEFGFGSSVTHDGGSVTVANGAAVLFDPGCTFTNALGNLENDGSLVINGTFSQDLGAVNGHAVVVLRGNLNVTGSGAGRFGLESSSTLSGATIFRRQVVTVLATAREGASAALQNNMTNRGAIVLDGRLGSAAIAGAFTLTNLGTLSTEGTNPVLMDLNVTNARLMDLQAVDTETGGSYQINNQGTVQMGTESKLAMASGGYTQAKSGTLVLHVNGKTFSQITGSAALSLAGTLTVLSGTPPPAGSTLAIISGSSLTGRFNTVNSSGQVHGRQPRNRNPQTLVGRAHSSRPQRVSPPRLECPRRDEDVSLEIP